MLCPLVCFVLARPASSQDHECFKQGDIVCCALKYDGSRNFFNTARGSCDEVVDTCATEEEYDPHTNTCVDLTSALESLTGSQSLPIEFLAQAPMGETTSSLPSIDCGAHGSPDASDPSGCVCDAGWASGVLAHGPRCNTPVLKQSQHFEFGKSVNGTVTISKVVKQTTIMGTIFANGGLVWVMVVLVLCCCCCYGCQLYIRRPSSKATSSPAPSPCSPCSSCPNMPPSPKSQQPYESQQAIFRQQPQTGALPLQRFCMHGQEPVPRPGGLSPTSYPPPGQSSSFSLPTPIARPLVPPRKSMRQSRRT